MHGCRHCCRPFYVGPCYLAEWSYSERDFSSHYSPYLDHDFPMMMEVDFESIRSVGKILKVFCHVDCQLACEALFHVSCGLLFLMVLFRSLISTDLARQYLAGAVLLGAAPCTAMVLSGARSQRGTPPIQWCRLLRMISLFLWHLSPSCVFFWAFPKWRCLTEPSFERHSLCPHPPCSRHADAPYGHVAKGHSLF